MNCERIKESEATRSHIFGRPLYNGARKDLPPATTDPYIAHRNLSAAIDHYGTRNNLCPMIMSSLEAGSNLSAATNLKLT